MDQHAHAGDKEQPDGRERIEQETGVDVEGGERAVFLYEVQMAIAAAQPGINNFLERLVKMLGRRGPVRILPDGAAGEQEREDDYADADSR